METPKPCLQWVDISWEYEQFFTFFFKQTARFLDKELLKAGSTGLQDPFFQNGQRFWVHPEIQKFMIGDGAMVDGKIPSTNG